MVIVVCWSLKSESDWFTGADGVSKGYIPSGISKDYAVISPFRRLFAIFCIMQYAICSLAATEDIRSRVDLTELQFRNSM